MSGQQPSRVCAGSAESIAERGCVVVSGDRHGIAVFHDAGKFYAIDNRCPHMGFPLNKGSVRCGILTCHWHHARFDLESGGAFDPFADDVRVYATDVRDGQVWVDVRPPAGDRSEVALARLRDGLEQNLPLVMMKAILTLRDAQVPLAKVVETAAAFGVRYRAAGWGPGLTILTAMGNVLPVLAPDEQALALYHGSVHVANDSERQPPRFDRSSLPTRAVPNDRLKEWFRQFVEVRDSEGAQRALLTAIENANDPAVVSDLLVSAATDHYFLNGGHTIDFINKAFEMLEQIGWEHASTVLPSIVEGLVRAQRSEESNAWRYPIDLVALLEPALALIPEFWRSDASALLPDDDFARLVQTMLGDDPRAVVDGLVAALRSGVSYLELSRAVADAAALRIARFHTSNEFGDWITVLHTFTYANAIHQSLTRAPSPEALRGVFHGAMRLYLDRFLNVPAARLPTDGRLDAAADEFFGQLAALLDRQQQVNEAGDLTYRYLVAGRPDSEIIQALGRALLHEDAEFHSYQMFEAGVRQYTELKETHRTAAPYVLVGTARYLAAHAPTSRAMLQTARIAVRLQRGDDLTLDDEG